MKTTKLDPAAVFNSELAAVEISTLIPGDVSSTLQINLNANQYVLQAACTSTLEIESHTYSTTLNAVSNLSLGSPLTKHAGTPYITVSKGAGFVNTEADYVTIVTLTTYVTVKETATGNTFEIDPGFSFDIKVTLKENGCGQVTFIKTAHSLGPYFVVQDTANIGTFHIEVEAPALSVSTDCGLSYTDTMKKNGVAFTNYDKTNQLIIGD